MFRPLRVNAAAPGTAKGIAVSDIFAEVDEELRADRAQKLLKKYGGVLIGAAVFVVACVAGWQAWRAHEARETARIAAIFLDATKAAVATPGVERDTALLEFDKVTREGSPGYRSLSRLRAAAMRFDAGEKDAALRLWDDTANDTSGDPVLRDLASLLWVWHQVDTGAPDVLRARLGKLTAPDAAWRPLAEEAQALLDLREGRKEAARDILKRLAADPAAPDGVRARAGGLLERLSAELAG